MTEKISTTPIESLETFAQHADYSLLETLQPDPQASDDGRDHDPRQVFSGHYVPVTPTPVANPVYVSHSRAFFKELGLSDKLATSEPFMPMPITKHSLIAGEHGSSSGEVPSMRLLRNPEKHSLHR